MQIHVLSGPATPSQIAEMAEALESRIKFAVDIRRQVAAGGGEFHADCEQKLIDLGSSQKDIWGADLVVESGELIFEALINLVPSRNNPSMLILDNQVRRQVESVLRMLLPKES